MSVRTGVRRRRIAATAAAAAAAVALLPAQGAYAAPAAAATGHWVDQGRADFAHLDWTLRGRVAGLPGNAHGGSLEVDGDDDGTIATRYDWTCPTGAPIPDFPGQGTTCDLVGGHVAEQLSTEVGDFGTWLVRTRLDYPVDVTDTLTGEVTHGQLDLRARGLDPNTTTTTYRSYSWPDGSLHRDRTRTQQRGAVFSGSLLGIRLRDPRLETSRSEVSSYQTWTRQFSPAR